MPPLNRELSRNFSRNASGLFTRVGHGRFLIIGDSSLDIPDSIEPIYYLGNEEGDITAAAALIEIATACPLDKDVPVRYMAKDKSDREERAAPGRNEETIETLGFKAIGLVKDGPSGFYEFSKGTDLAKPPIYCLTASRFAYDCMAATIGHSQA